MLAIKQKVKKRLKYIAIAYVVLALMVLVGSNGIGGYSIIVNRTNSVDGLLFVLNKNDRLPKRDKLMAFYAPENPFYTNNRQFMKYVWGIQGDSVRFGSHGELFINDVKRGVAKPRTLKGRPLARCNEGIIGKGEVFFGTTHKDSFDSRYKLIGNIYEKDIIGTTRRLL